MDIKKKLGRVREFLTLRFLEAAEIIDNEGMKEKLQKSLSSQYVEEGDYEKAIECQKQVYDSIEEENTEEKGNASRYLGKLYFKTGDYGKSIACCIEYLENASRDRKKEARARKILGLSYQNCGQNNEAIPHLKRCLELLEELGKPEDKEQALKNEKEKAEANGSLGIAYRELGEYEKAIEHLEKCLEISEKKEFRTLAQQTFIELGCIYKALKQRESARKYFHHSLRLASELEDKAKIAKAYNYLAEAYLSQHQPQKAILYLEEARKKGDRLASLTHLELLGCAYLMNKQPRKATECFEEYLSEKANEADISEKANVMIKTGKSYGELDNHEMAIGYYWKGLEMIKQFEEKKIESEAFEGLGDSYYKTGKYDNAQMYYKEALKISSALDDKQLEGRVYIKLGDIFRVQGNTQDAYPHYFGAQTIAESIGDKEMEADAYEGLGNATSEHETAIDYHKKNLQLAIDLDDRKRQQQAHENLGNAYLTGRKLLEAIESYESCCVMAKAREDIAVVYRCKKNMGNAYFENKDYDNAILHHEISLETATKMKYILEKTELYRVLGYSYSKINQPKKALAYYYDFLRTVDEKMDNFKVATVYLDAGKLCTECGDDKEAFDLHCKCLNLVKDNLELKQEVLEKLGDTCYKNSQYDDACNYYLEIDQLSIKEPDRRCQINYKLGKARLSGKDIPMATQYYFTALDFARDEKIKADIFEALGDAFYLNKDYDNAFTYHIQNLESVKRISDEKRQQRAYENLGDVCSARGQWFLAVDYIESAAKVGGTEDKMIECERKLGTAYYHVRNYQKAIECLESANEKSQLKEKYEIIGRAYVKINQYKKAIQYFSKDLATDQNDKLKQAMAHGNIGRVFVKTGKIKDAIECHKKALELTQQSDDKNAEAKGAEAEAYCNLGCAYQANGQYAEAMENQEQSLKLAENLNSKSQQGRAHKKMGNIHSVTGEYKKAIDCYYACLEMVEETEKSTRVRVLGKLSSMWSSIGQNDMVVKCRNRQADIAEDPKDKGRAYANLGVHFELIGDYVQALKYQEEYLKVAKEMDDDTEQGHACVNIGKVHLARGEYKEAIRKSKTAEELGNKDVKARAYSVMGCAYRELGQYITAKDTHRKEMDMINFNDYLRKAQAYGNIGMAHVGTGDYENAISCFRDQMKLVQKIEDKREEQRVNENFGNYYAAIGDCNNAILFYNKSLELAKSVGDKAGIGRVKGCIGAIYTEIGQYQKAVECHGEEIKVAKELGNKVREGQALGNLGNAYVGLCKYQEAIKLLKDSKKIAEEYNVQADERHANKNLGNAYVATGQYEDALDFLGRALRISKHLGHKATEGRILESIARAYYLSGQIKKSIESGKKSLTIARDVGDRAGEGRALGTLSNAYIEFGQDYRTAISHLRRYLKISEELSNEASKEDALESMAAVFIEIGQFNKALKCCDEALTIAKNLEDKAREGRAYGSFGKLYTAIGKYDKAIENHHKHLKIATDLEDKIETGRANGNLGNAYNANNRHKEAITCHKKDKDIAEELNNNARKARAEGNMGNTFTNIGQFEKALNCHLERLTIAEKLEDKPSLAKALLGLGVHYIKTNHFGKAIEYLNQLEEISRPTDLGSRELTAVAQEMLGKCYLEKNEVPKACSYFAKSIINFQEIRESVRAHDEFNISMSNRFAHVHKLLFQSLLNIKEEKTALLVSDCGKAQALYDLMWKMVQSHPGFSFKSFDLMEKIANNASSASSENLFKESLLHVINSNQADTIISYVFGEDGALHSWVISQRGFNHETLNITNERPIRNYLCEQIEDLNRQLNDTVAPADGAQDAKKVHDLEARTCNPFWQMSDGIESDREQLAETSSPEYGCSTNSRERGPSTMAFDRQTAQNSYLRDLYAKLIQPVEEHLTGSKLLIVPEGPLFTLPFAALLDSNGNHLCDKYRLQFIPSLHVLNSCLSTQPEKKLGPALFVGNPAIRKVYLDGRTVDLIPLPFAEEEVIKCSRYFNAEPLVQFKATKENVLNGMKTASILHIAAHGNKNRAEIFLRPNEGDPHDTSSFLLTAEDILKTRLKARLVVLSSCHSGCGQISAEGVVGIARSFMGSGARAVLVALWSIDDKKTKEFMIELYEKLIDQHPVCTALQKAMAALKGKYWETRLWAQFQLFGENIVFTEEEIEEIRDLH